MSISKEDIKKLADLARIEVTETEAEGLKGDIESILGYVGQVKEVTGSASAKASVNEVELGPVINVLREDENPTEPGTYTADIVAEFPDKEGNYLKVKKIL